MTNNLASPFFQFVLNPKQSNWSLHGLTPESPALEGVWMRVTYRMSAGALLRVGKRRFRVLERWRAPQVTPFTRDETPHGPLKGLRLAVKPDENGLACQLEFALSQEYPLFLWRLRLTNQGARPVYLQKLEMLRAGFFPQRKLLPNPGRLAMRYLTKPLGYGTVRPHPNPGEPGFFSNGWQSWSFTGAYGRRDRYRHTRLWPFAAPLWFNPGSPRPRRRGHFVSEMFGVLGDRAHRRGILAGFLSQKQHFGTLEAYIGDPLYPALSLWAHGDDARLDPGATLTTDWAVIQFVEIDDPDPLGPYIEAVAREHSVTTDHRPPEAGWCSWYYFFQDIDAGKIRTNLKAAQETREEVPLDLIQIDDGFEAQVGDWFEFGAGFPKGVAPLAKEIKQAGFTPGLWLAPFIVHPRARLARRHRGWLLRNRWGLPVNAGFVWNAFTRALDLTHPEALAYACDVVRTAAREWGYPYLKLDFLYAAALRGHYRDRTKTRAQVLRAALEALREAAGPETTLLGCGCPIGSGIGLVEAMRIGADVAPSWEPRFMPPHLLFRNEWNMPATRNALQNALARAALHNRWWVNDPDCLLLRPDSELTLAEVQSLATAIAMSGGALLLSDDLPQLPTERLRIAAQLLPLIGKRPRVVDWFDETDPRLLRLDLENATGRWHLLAAFNWTNRPCRETLPLAAFELPLGEYLAREFWNGDVFTVSGESLPLREIPPHGVRLFALRPRTPGEPQYLGGDLHISQGLEVTQWSVHPREGVRFALERPGRVRGEVLLALPRPPRAVTLNEQPITWSEAGEGIYCLPVAFNHMGKIRVRLE